MNARKPRPTNETSHLLPKKIRLPLEALVVDANAYGAVGPDITNLAALAKDLDAIGIYTWIPQPVAWEWADHLAQQWTAARNAIKIPANHLRRAGLLPLLRLEPRYDDRAAFIAAFLDRLDRIPHVEVVPLTGESAVEGLKDQILQRPPAKTKTDQVVKTGGSDSAWLRDVIAKAHGAAGGLLFLSEDKDIEAAYREWGYDPPPILLSLRDIRASLFEDVPASAEDTWLVVQHLVDRMPVDLRDPAPAAEADASLIGNTLGLVEVLDPDPVDYQVVTAANLTQLTALAGLGLVTRKQPEPDDNGEGSSDRPAIRTLMATAFFLADAEATETYRDVDSEVTTDTVSRTGLLVRTRLVFEVHDQTITNARSDSDAVVFTSSRFDDNWDALEELGEALAAVPGLELPEDWGDWKNDTEQQIEIAGKDEVIDLFWSYGDSGNLSLILGDEEVSVHCEYDEDAWVGGRDGFHLDPPYYIVTEGTPFATADAIWAIPAWIIARLVQPDSQVEADA